MNLYERDYGVLTNEEKSEWDELRALERERAGHIRFTPAHSMQTLSKGVRHHRSLFPNNYLDACELKEVDRLKSQFSDFVALFRPESDGLDERSVLKFIRETRSYFIVGALLSACRFGFGHHETHLFPEFALGTSFKVDYLLVGKCSGGWEFVFVEFEAPSGNSVRKDGSLGEPFRKGIGQIEDWRVWLQANFPGFRESIERHSPEGRELPSEFTKLDVTRFHFVVVSGRRDQFTEKTYRLCREKHDVRLLHYDNLIDAAHDVIGKSSY